MADQTKNNNIKKDVQKHYQQELSRYHKQIEKTKKVLVRPNKAD